MMDTDIFVIIPRVYLSCSIFRLDLVTNQKKVLNYTYVVVIVMNLTKGTIIS